MMQNEIAENLRDAGCGDTEIREIMNCVNAGNTKNAQKQIDVCRRKALEQMHACQKNIDRLDYLQYRLERGK
ncbi:MAG: hypothetical protein E7185_09405 [Erysipelotrichaceae bacterium]|nr:hypothetical protein [Erysipelotrichaceae bacterium]